MPIGEICALATAVCWTVSGVTFAIASRIAGGLHVNHLRLLVGAPVLLLVAWLVTGSAWPVGEAAGRLPLLYWSGFVGLVVGDVAYFYALAVIGPRVSSVIMGTWPAMTVGIRVFMGHSPRDIVLAGVAMVVLGVTMVLLKSREGTAWNPGMTGRQWALGVVAALIGTLGQAGTTVLAREAMADPGGVDPFRATAVRMVVGLIGLQVIATISRRPFGFVYVLKKPRAFGMAMIGCLFGPIIGVTLSMVATQQAEDVAVAASLMATTPIFMVPVAIFGWGARVSKTSIAGTLLTVAGAVVCIMGRARPG
jgi:drug/metabolite transporter (DMT)-like permease